MTTTEAVELRKTLERDILALLHKYRDETGMTPNSVDVKTMDVTVMGNEAHRSIALVGVRVTVEL